MTTYKRCTYRVSAKAVIKIKGKLLLVREDSQYWDLPGGGVEHFESPEDALKREVAEETGLTVSAVATDGVSVWATYDKEHDRPLLFLVYPTKVTDGVHANASAGVELATFSDEELATLPIEPHLEQYRKAMQEA